MRLFYWIGCLLCSAILSVSAQSTLPKSPVHLSTELGGLATSGPQNPFWLRTNQYGMVPERGSLGTLRVGIWRDYKARPDSVKFRKKNRFDWGFSVLAALNTGPEPTSQNPTVVLPDAFLKVRFGWLELYGGNRREVFGLGDTLLTSGFVAWSGNAMPFPKIQLHTPEFVPLGFTKKLIAVKAGYAHGWFTNTYIQDSYLHQKYLYVRIGKPHWKVRIYGGLNHQVQWGGHADYLKSLPFAVDGTLPSTFQDYVSLLTGRYPNDISNSRYTDFDGTNRIGNHLGTYDFALEWKGHKKNWMLYHQHIYEDASGLAFRNIPDGLTGLRYMNRNPGSTRFQLQRMVVEWLSTTNQSGDTFDPDLRYQGRDNYFNHGQYTEGWSYKGRTIGTPFIAPRADFTQTVNDFTGGGYFPNNRLVAWYVGASGGFANRFILTARASYSRNFGTYDQPYPEPFHQFSGLLSTQFQPPRWKNTLLKATFALDRGELFPDALGGFVSLKRIW